MDSGQLKPEPCIRDGCAGNVSVRSQQKGIHSYCCQLCRDLSQEQDKLLRRLENSAGAKQEAFKREWVALTSVTDAIDQYTSVVQQNLEKSRGK